MLYAVCCMLSFREGATTCYELLEQNAEPGECAKLRTLWEPLRVQRAPHCR